MEASKSSPFCGPQQSHNQLETKCHQELEVEPQGLVKGRHIAAAAALPGGKFFHV